MCHLLLFWVRVTAVALRVEVPVVVVLVAVVVMRVARNQRALASVVAAGLPDGHV